MPKCFVGEPFCAVFQKFSGSEKLMDNRVGVSRFSVENFIPHIAENFRRGESFSVSLFSGTKKFYASEGYVTILGFLSKFFCPTLPKSFVGELFCAVFYKFSGSEKIYG